MIGFEHISKRYGERTIIDDLDLDIGEGEFFVLLGPSGCGKTTTLRLINALIAPSAGRVLVGGEDVARVDPQTLRRGIGYVIQSVGLFPHWSVADNIATVPRLLGWPDERIKRRVAELLELLHLEARTATLLPHHLSGGQQQRVGVARALAADPPVLLMDEPFGAVDPVTRTALQDEIMAIHERTRKTVVFVTHDVDEALKLASRIGLMDEGRLVALGAPRDVLDAPDGSFARDFLGGSELGLRLLAVETAGSRARDGGDATAPTIPAGASLREALSLMVARRTDRIGVRDGENVKTLRLDDLVRR
jgi:osmoprotectant transport system ATP-binding protein